MKLSSMLRRTRPEPLPLLPTARMEGRPSTWSGEKLERLLTPREIEQVLHGDL